MANIAFIYAIKNIHNGNMYIGSTVDYKSRWHTHRSALNNGRHHSFILQKAWDKYGKDAFDFKLLLICSSETRYFYEQSLMRLQKYNVYRTVNECKVRGGWKHSESFKAKMSSVHKGKSLSDEHKKKLSDVCTGRKYDENFKQKARNRQLGISPSAVTRGKLSVSAKAHHAESTKKRNLLVKEIYNSYEYGDKLIEMVKSKDISLSTFYNTCKELNLQPVKKKALNELIEKIKELVNSGESFKSACLKLDVNYATVSKIYKSRAIL